MLVDVDPPESAPGGSDRSGDLVVPYPVPSGMLQRHIGVLSEPDAHAARTISFMEVEGLTTEERVGWQVGVLVRLLPHQPTAIRGVDPMVLRRVQEVLRRIGEAR